MRFGRIALIMGFMFIGTGLLQAQPAHSGPSAACGCPQCAAGSGVFSDLGQSLAQACGCFLPGFVGCDARHKIYRAALIRNTFDKKCLLPIAYSGHLLPFYSKHRCCCGPVTAAPCPDCQPQGPMGEEVIEMHEVPDAMPLQEAPEVQESVPTAPSAVAPPREAQRRAKPGRSTARATGLSPQKRTVPGPSKPSVPDRLAQGSGPKASNSLGDFIQVMLRPSDEASSPVLHRGGAAMRRDGSSEVTPGVDARAPHSGRTTANHVGLLTV